MRHRFLFLSLLLCLALSGCGRVKNPVAGQVIRNGMPVESGVVRFTPNVQKGVDGPTVTLKIRDGRFSSVTDRLSMVPGEHSVEVFVPPAVLRPDAPTESRRFSSVNIPEGGTSDLTFDVTRKPRKKGQPFDPELDE
jgi:hypothetical protein